MSSYGRTPDNVPKPQCSASTGDQLNNRGCANSAVGDRHADGKYYCGTHHPDTVERRRAKAKAIFDRRMALIAFKSHRWIGQLRLRHCTVCGIKETEDPLPPCHGISEREYNRADQQRMR